MAGTMRLALELRAELSIMMALASPLLAVVLTLATGAALFAVLGKPPVEALRLYFFDPLTDAWALQEIAVKATPLVLIGVGLSMCYLANAWNIGAEGQFLVGAITGGWLAVVTHGTDAGYWVLPAMLILGAPAGALAGLAGIIEVSATVNHLQPNISPGYGFTAIIVAFLGRLHPIGILIASLFLALTFIGGEAAQISLKVPLDLTKVFQGILLFYVLACDTLILYRFRLVS